MPHGKRRGPKTGHQLKLWRKRMGYTQSQLADEIGVLRGTVARWETNQRAIPAPISLLLDLIKRCGGH